MQTWYLVCVHLSYFGPQVPQKAAEYISADIAELRGIVVRALSRIGGKRANPMLCTHAEVCAGPAGCGSAWYMINMPDK